ncbi:hypothetical protein T4B_11379 [Trichinella pseudospiralis]|uniref:Uncharacterized protein n=2 Tax=Trichinella pseudospiralis TaxID=6337 RepID=A0A0V1FKF9_TRIPS|nr:hypothetical protein T4D_9124 [Trichinella pseudospiralis]KRZ20489.1 hypothetical protein T4B_11379 [Trichinella pseudospiralis]
MIWLKKIQNPLIKKINEAVCFRKMKQYKKIEADHNNKTISSFEAKYSSSVRFSFSITIEHVLLNKEIIYHGYMAK